MKAIIKLDVPAWQIGQNVQVYFPDTMLKRGICEPDQQIRCRDCVHYTEEPGKWECDLYDWVHEGDWYCADARKK